MPETFDVAPDPSRPCPICRGDRFVWGRVRDSESTRERFVADGLSFLGALSGEGAGSVRTRMCLGCRHLGSFVIDGTFESL